MRKKERNRKYYACKSEQLKARGLSLNEQDPGKKKAAAQAYYDARREERKASFSSYNMMLTRRREKCWLGLIMMPTRRGDRHH